ncbi:glycosyltransferase [Actinopolymorpha alba]|uniref:glycosyltransferase n=1 Tax=Actinopolymorpha alba TaxID=533267 RepID=UPI0004774376|nr:glycosyltransferase [Actinopolymorpha alba]
MPRHVILVVRSWPRLSQTFILNEVLALERRGLALTVVSLVRSRERHRQPQVDQVRARVRFLDDRGPAAIWARITDHLAAFAGAPGRYLATFFFALTRPWLGGGYATCSALRSFGHGVQVAALAGRLRRAGEGHPHLHAHFAHDPALVGMLARRLTGLPFSFTAHARDLYQTSPRALIARAAEAKVLVTCCRANADYIARTIPTRVRPLVRVIHHGVELDQLTPSRTGPAGTNGAQAKVLSVGRLVEKKGFDDLLRACARLAEAGHAFSLDIYGDGPLRPELTALVDRLRLGSHVTFHGERDRNEIVRALATADVFALTPCVTGDGDRDGIPNVLVEAMACGLPVVTTSAGGIPELVRDGDNGLLASPGDVAAIAAHLAALLADPEARRELGARGRHTVESGYDVDAAAAALDAIFRPQTAVPAGVRP